MSTLILSRKPSEKYRNVQLRRNVLLLEQPISKLSSGYGLPLNILANLVHFNISLNVLHSLLGNAATQTQAVHGMPSLNQVKSYLISAKYSYRCSYSTVPCWGKLMHLSHHRYCTYYMYVLIGCMNKCKLLVDLPFLGFSPISVMQP